ncbi:TPA: hypothetical protein IUV20_002562 [Enterococcus faecalis]|nr:hypothetical protein [Enterococcus faecalis]
MKQVFKCFSLLGVLLIGFSVFVSAGTSVYAAEETTKQLEYEKKLRKEIDTIYTQLIRYDELLGKYVVDERLVEASYQTDREIQGVYLLKDALNDKKRQNSEVSGENLLSIAISESNYVLDGNDVNNLLPVHRISKRSAWDTITKCIQEAWKGAISLVTIKGIVNLLKAGKFEAAAAKLASSLGGKVLGVAGAALFLLTCGAVEAS